MSLGDRGTLVERVASRLASAKHSAAPLPSAPSLAVVPPRPAVDSAPPAEAIAKPDDAFRPVRPPVEINFNRLLTAGFITPNSPPSRLTEEYRLIKRQIIKDAFPDGAVSGNSNIVMVTSSIPGEGKTFTALNLAMSLVSEPGLHVLLVDGDAYHHSLAGHIGVGEEMGLADLLIDSSLKMPDVMLRTNVPNLSFIPPGRPHPHRVEILASKPMARMMADLARRYPDRIIIIDTPPVLVSTEASVLAAYVGQVVVVVEKGRTTNRSLKKTIDLLQGCSNLNCILNKCDLDLYKEGYDSYAYQA
ncbi:XrtA-associated tyrosine autokinase [Magnetospirillum molischianum]|uniref:non-specific protein-tyrosine kinase n=1 Tax=Magnetospirillum molischianum DSM 120 TaxID=1150626 RepID=H8FQB4_MAGML|nr:XrtA-associated tyrosine autokinase [Magnetospirillum molischianum]CCG40552.1 ATPases involved in chromosome partitioning-like [Magnetospirillum molischianum DSM 120]